MRLVKFLRETYTGDEHLVVNEDTYMRLRIVKPEAIGDKKQELTNLLASFSRIKHPGILVPEAYDLRDIPRIYFPYLEGKPVNLEDKAERDNFVLFLLNLLRELVHRGIAIPVISVEDFLEAESFFMLPPCWINPDCSPEGRYVFAAPEFINKKKISVASTVYVFGRLIDSVSDTREVKEFVANFLNEDPNKRKTHFPTATYFLSDVDSSMGLMGLRVATIHRLEENEILEAISSHKEGVKTIFVYGPQRIGKTTLLSAVSDQLRNEGIPVIWATDLEALTVGILQFVDDKVLPELDEQDKRWVESAVLSSQLSASETVLRVAKILNNLSPVVIVVDDAHEIDVSLRAVLEQLQKYNFSSGHTLILASFHKDISLNYDHLIELKPFDLFKTKKMISAMLATDERQVEEFSRWIHAISHGLPGRVVELIRIMFKSKALQIEENGVIIKQEILNKTDFSQILLPSLAKTVESGAHLLAILGERFEIQELDHLCSAASQEIFRINLYLTQLNDNGLIYWEEGRYRFTVYDIWKSLYEQIEPNQRLQLHDKLAAIVHNPVKKAWHLKMLGRKIAAIVLYLLIARKELANYHDVSTALSLLEEAERLLEGRESYALNSLKLKALRIKQDSNALERYALTLSKKHDFLRYSALVHASKMALAKQMEEQTKLFESRTNYGRLSKLCCKMMRMLFSGEKVPEELLSEVEVLLSNLRDTKLHKALRSRTLLLIAQNVQRSSISNLELLNQARQIAQSEGILDVLASILNELGTRLAATAEAEGLFEHVIEIAHRIGSDGLALTALSNMTWTSLYRGDVNKMFQYLERLRQFVRITGNLQLEAYSYFLEANFHMYNRELDEALEDYTRELSIERYLGIEERALRGIVCSYAMSEDLDKARQTILENIENPAMNYPGFVQFRDLFLAENDTTFMEAWQRFLKRDSPYWAEETCQIFAERLMRIDKDGFLKLTKQLEANAIKAGAFLSLAQVYESQAIAYKSVNAIPLAVNYAERAISIYRTRSFLNAALWLERKINHLSEVDTLKMMDELQAQSNEYSKQILIKIKEQMERTVRNSEFVQHVLDILKVTDPQDEIHTAMEFLVSKMMNLLPISSAGLVLQDSRGKVLEYVGFNVDQVPKQTKVTYTPFELCSQIEVYDGFTVVLYVANRSLHLDDSSGYELTKMVLNLQEVIVYALKNIIIYHRSVTDPLTGLHTRWYFTSRLHEEFERVKRYGGHFSVIMCDIDDFKKINDTYGHRMGDEVLKFIASVLRSSTRASDILGRYGGEEFILILPNTNEENAARVAEKILYQIIETNPFDFRVTMSFGVAGYPEHTVFEPEDLIALADKATYASKERGGLCHNLPLI
ncbi:MAG TPA: diguanylate cyclase [Pseudothermotoga sp.]|nr:diguanylate cyclase [Pseudothermotoga sp.]HOK83657.1 diguanylate cyclase [Pseudothermotoga sp.]HPP69296.1 diguanylate cyclase [Pseudothermotoga sp.]